MTHIEDLEIKELAEELGYPATMGDELYYYSAQWDEIEAEHERVNKEAHKHCGCDVRTAGFVLSEIGIFSNRQFAETDDNGDWIIYWG